MKKIVTILFCWLSLCVPLYAADFVEIFRDDKCLIYVDVDSIESRISSDREHVVAWAKWIYRGDSAKEISERYDKKVDHSMDFSAYSKESKQYQLLYLHYYDGNGDIIDSNSWPFVMSDYEEIIPGTYSETVYNFIMYHFNRVK